MKDIAKKALKAGAAAAGSAAALGTAAAFGAWLRVFWVDRKRAEDPYHFTKMSIYGPHGEEITRLVDAVTALPYEEVSVTSFDGYTLWGKLYMTDPKAPVQILFHGYRSNGFSDFCGGLQLALKCGFNAILVDQRAHGKSGGPCLSFGIFERFDAKTWAEYAAERFGEDTPVILAGISMGAGTVLSAADLELPKGVKGIIADCGYTSARDIITHVAARLGYPVKPALFFVSAGARLFGGFGIDDAAPKEALRRTALPVLLIHGEDDSFVPCRMSRENYLACASERRLFTVPGAIHGMSYVADPEGYEREVREFCARCLGENE